MIVPNSVLRDSRVQRAARSVKRAGYRITLVGAADHEGGARLVGDVLAVRLNVERTAYHLTERRRRRRELADLEEVRAVDLRIRSARRGAAAGGRARAAATPLGIVLLRVRRRWLARPHRARWASVRGARDAVLSRLASAGGWRTTWPHFVDLEDAFAPTVVALEPDLIHVHDAPLLPAADTAARQLRASGRSVRVVYDAHEWWPGSVTSSPLRQRVTMRVEDAYAPRVDAVVTVGPTLARWLQARHGLRRTPVVVQNGPSATAVPPPPDRSTIRAEVGLADDVPLLVSSGSTAPVRGLATVVRALPALPGVHLALVALAPAGKEVCDLRALAADLGVEDRLHALPYVPQESVTSYLASADIGLAPFHRTASHDSALATKVSEYLVAGLPVIGSDCVTMAEFLRGTGVGEVFTAQDVDGFAAAVRRVLADPLRYRAAMTPELVRSRTWEHQEQGLIDLYQELVGPAGGGVPRSGQVVIGEGDRLARAVQDAGPAARPVVRYRASGAPSHARQAAAVALLAQTADADSVLYVGARSGFGPLTGPALVDEVGLLTRRGVKCTVRLAPGERDPELERRLADLGVVVDLERD